eukprot:6208154-Pleurochrysis_carterae.AAC.6
MGSMLRTFSLSPEIALYFTPTKNLPTAFSTAPRSFLVEAVVSAGHSVNRLVDVATSAHIAFARVTHTSRHACPRRRSNCSMSCGMHLDAPEQTAFTPLWVKNQLVYESSAVPPLAAARVLPFTLLEGLPTVLPGLYSLSS